MIKSLADRVKAAAAKLASKPTSSIVPVSEAKQLELEVAAAIVLASQTFDEAIAELIVNELTFMSESTWRGEKWLLTNLIAGVRRDAARLGRVAA